MKIISCDESHRERWNAFVERSPLASVYHRFEWRDINRACFGHRSVYLAAVENDEVIGILPMVRLISRLFGRIACSMPFVNYGGVCAETPDAERALLEAGKGVCDEWRVDYLELRSQRELGHDLPVARHKVSMTIALDRDPDVLWKNYRTGHRQDVRRGYKNGFTARCGGEELLDDFFVVLAESWRDLGTPIYRKTYLREIARLLTSRVRLCVVYAPDGEPAAAAFDALHHRTVEGMWLGTRSRYRRDYAGYVLYWELIRSASEQGFERFHLGRSTAESGAEVFKRKWNAETTQLYWYYVLRRGKELPQLNVNNPKYRLAIDIWRKLPVPVTQMIGPFIARSIP